MSKQKKAPPRNSRKSSLSAKAKRAKATRLEAKLIRMAEQTEPDPRDPLAAKSLRDFRSAPGFLHKDDKPELLAQIAELGNGNSSLTDVKDETEEKRLVRVCREKLVEFEKHEHHHSKELAAALIALHTLESKPRYGRFVECTKEIGFKHPQQAYRLMKMHGWKSIRKPAPPIKIAAEQLALIRSKAIIDAFGYLNQFVGAELKRERDQFVADLDKELGAKLGAK
jgi:hypothetical protein